MLRVTFVLLIAACASAQTPPKRKPKTEIGEIRATGCVRQAPQSHCLLLETLDGGTTYTFLASPQTGFGHRDHRHGQRAPRT